MMSMWRAGTLGEADQAMADAAAGFSRPAADLRQLYREQWLRDAQRRSGARLPAPDCPAPGPLAEQRAFAPSYMQPCKCSCGELIDTRATGPGGRPKEYASQACRARAYRARHSAAKADR